MNGISNNPILLLFCVIFVFMRTHFEIPCWAITCAYRCLFILYRSSCHNYFVRAYEYLYERIKSILYPVSSRFLNKILFLLEKLLKKWKYFYDSWGNRSMRHKNILFCGEDFNGLKLKFLYNTWSHFKKFFSIFSLNFTF
jgi:hypothetical protein